MTLVSQTQNITTRFAAQSPVAAANIAWDFFGLPHGTDAGPFTAPTIDPTDPGAAIWQRIKMLMTPRSGRPLGIGQTALTWRSGLTVVDTYNPLIAPPLTALQHAQTAGLAFHRTRIGNVTWEDMTGPIFVEDPAWPNFEAIQVQIPFYVLDPSTTYVEDSYVL